MFGRTTGAVSMKFYESRRRNKSSKETENKVEVPKESNNAEEIAKGELKKCVEKINLLTQENDALRRELDATKRKALNAIPPRELVRHLYNLGYRIEDGGLYVITKRQVMLNDILDEKA